MGRAQRGRVSRGREANGEWRWGVGTLLPIIELCKCSPGMVTAMGVSVGLTGAAIMAKGTLGAEAALGA